MAAGTECQGGGIVRRGDKVGLLNEKKANRVGLGSGDLHGDEGDREGGKLGKRDVGLDLDVTDVFVGSNGRGGIRLRGRMALGERRMMGLDRG